ncbi:hypothetical protein GCM10010407_15960 [Rarobacter incanus]
MAVITVFVGIFAWHALGSLTTLGVYLLLAFFLSLALEPVVLWLVKHKWKRGRAAAASLVGFVLVALIITALFGQLLVQQVMEFSKQAPQILENLRDSLDGKFGLKIPETSDLLSQAMTRFGDDVTSGALAIGTGVVSGIFATMTIMLVTYYLMAAGPRFRASICGFLPAEQQTEVLRFWEITQDKVSGFISSRLILALFSSLATFACLTILGTPYSVPLSLFMGIVSQFIPTIGTYIGGALPVLVALAGQGWVKAVIILGFLIAYQQVENLLLQPKISAKALEMNPAVAFIVVIAFGSVFGAIGAFLGLPIAAVIQAGMSTYIRRHELIDSEMLHDPNQTGPVVVQTGGGADQSVAKGDDEGKA